MPVNASITFVFSASLSHPIKHSVSIKIPEPAAANDVNDNVPEFIHDAKSGKYLESCYSEHKYVFAVKLVTCNEKRRVHCLVRKLNLVEYDRFLKYVLPRKKVRVFYFHCL